MVGDTPPYDSHDERDDLAALDFSVADTEADHCDLDALSVAGDEHMREVGALPTQAGGPPAQGAGGQTAAEADEHELPVPVFTVTNPPGTVTVTAFLDGRVKQIDLSPKVTDMTETDLAAEIVVIAGLATQDAKSAQYAFMLEGMREQGHDDAATRDFLTRDLDLPSPEQAQAARAQIFATRYAGDHD